MISQKDLQEAIESGIINTDDVQTQLNKQKRKKILDNHPYAITQGTGKDKRWRTTLPCEDKANNRILVLKTHLKDLENAIVDYYESQNKTEELDKLTLKTLYPRWLNYKRQHTNAKNTIDRIDDDWNKYYVDTAVIDVPISQLTKLMLDEWAHGLIQQYTLTKKQYFNLAIIMKQGLEYAIDLDIIEISPLSLIKINGKRMFKKVKKPPNTTQIFFPNEVNQIVSLAWNDFEKYHKRFKHKLAPLSVIFQFETGVRIGELCAIHNDDLIYVNGVLQSIHIQRMLRYTTNEIVEHTKSDCGDREIPLTPNAVKIIETVIQYKEEHLIDTNGFIFSVNERHIPMDSISDLYVKYCKLISTTHKGSHKARKTFISALLRGQVCLDTVRILAGHESEKTTLSNYLFDLNTDEENRKLMADALNYQKTS